MPGCLRPGVSFPAKDLRLDLIMAFIHTTLTWLHKEQFPDISSACHKLRIFFTTHSSLKSAIPALNSPWSSDSLIR